MMMQKQKKKRRPRRKFKVANLPLGVGQPSYSLQEDMVGRKADITFGQLMELAPKMKRQWKAMGLIQLKNNLNEDL